jgi:hypothetical protein
MTRPRALFALSMALSCAHVFAADKIRVVNEGDIRDEWILPAGFKLAVPTYPAEYAAQRAEACVAIGYLVNADGSTSDFALLKSWTSANVPSGSTREYWSSFAQASAQALSQWRFQPRPEVQAARPVYTVATLLFAAQTPELRARCAIPNLAARLRELRGESGTRRRMDVDLYDRLDVDPLRYERDEQGREARETGARRTPGP